MRYSRLKIKCSGELLEEIENYRTENVVVAAFLTSVKEGILERLSMNEGVSLAKEVRFTLPLDVYEAVQGENVELTNREFELLHTLMRNKNIVLTREKLLNEVCGYDYVGETNIIDVYVRYLRTKIDDHFGIKLIQTVRGVGYCIKES